MSAIASMNLAQKKQFLRYGDHARRCQWRLWAELPTPERNQQEQPECDCGWLDALGEACK